MVAVNAGCEYMGGTRGSGCVPTADGVMETSVVRGVRGVRCVGGVCEMCMFLARGGIGGVGASGREDCVWALLIL